MSNSASGHARDLFLVSKPMFCGMINHLGPFSEASNRPEGQELGGEAVGGKEGLTQLRSMLETWFWCQMWYGDCMVLQ